MYVKTIQFKFTSGISDKQTLSETSVIGIRLPASFGGTSIALKAGELINDTTYLDVYDCSNALITFTVDATAARHYDFTDDFPASIRNVQLVSAGVPDGTIVKLVVKAT